MKQQIIQEIIIELIADEGMILTNGEIYTTRCILAKDDSPSNWWEITEEEYEALQEDKEEFLI